MIVLKQHVLVLFVLSSALATDNALDAHPNKDLLSSSICGTHSLNVVSSGADVSPGEFPWLALIQYHRRDSNKFLCGGFLINKRYIVTAAHCVHRGTIGGHIPNMVRLGEYDTAMDPDSEAYLAQDLGIEEEVVHENYSTSNLQNNIALIRLDRDVSVTPYVTPICLPSPEDDRELTKASNILEEVGWGITANNPRSNVPRRVRLPVVDDVTCTDIYKKFHRNVTGTQLCAGGDGTTKYCVGESGSPLMGHSTSGKYFALGIVSYGPLKCHAKGIPTVYTRVVSYTNWILDNIAP